MAKNLVILSFLSVVLATTAPAGDFDLSWFNIASGGSSSDGGGFEVNGTLGQFDSQSMAGGGFSLAGGFWPGASPDSGTPCPGDTDGDNDVDISDLSTLLSQFGLTGSGFSGDIDSDGDVDLSDLSLLLSQFGHVC